MMKIFDWTAGGLRCGRWGE